MALYTIGDLHLSLAKEKPMDIFGDNWNGHTEKLRQSFASLTDEDLTVLCGDLSWGMGLEETLPDFQFVDSLPGRKIILKGNHDYWWTTAEKLRKFCESEGIENLQVLNNNCFFYENIALCGTRGWFYDLDGEHNEKIFRRELIRLETSLKAAGEAAEKICFLHYPPLCRTYRCGEILQLLALYGVRNCYYGHLHGPGIRLAVEGERDGITYTLTSADHLGFRPLQIR